MDEENSDDELPSISLSQDSSTREVVMPSAVEVAVERERELRTELELRRLREQHSPPPAGEAGAGVGAGGGAPRSDSSGSEGEAALAAAVRALRVLPPPPRPRPAHALVARRLLALLPAPPNALQHYAAAFADDASPTVLRKAINQMVLAVSCALSCEINAWREVELVTAAGVLACAIFASPAPRPAARRALHRALAAAAPFPALVCTLADLVTMAALPEPKTASSSERLLASGALLSLSDAARGGPALAERLAALLVRHALTVLLAPNDTQECSEPLSTSELHALLVGGGDGGGWRALGPEARRTALRLAARALRAGRGEGEGAERARVLAALQHAPAGADRQHPDYLQVVVAASTLQLLFRPPTHQ